MFGYVIANRDELKIRDYKRYRSFYCGLCHSLRSQFGKKGQITLSYDMTFLDILLNALYEEPLQEDRQNCILHPLEKHDMLFNSISDYTASMGLLLTYYKLLDNWQDDKDSKSRTFAKSLRNDVVKINEKWIRQSKAVSSSIQKLSEYENHREYDLDTVSGLSGTMLGELFVYREDEWAAELRRMGFYLGKYIYLLDAYEDLEKDLKKQEYNPWTPFMSRKDYDALVENTLTMMMAECAKSFERLPIVQDVEILRNIIYSGVWTQYAIVKRKRDEKETGGADSKKIKGAPR